MVEHGCRGPLRPLEDPVPDSSNSTSHAGTKPLTGDWLLENLVQTRRRRTGACRAPLDQPLWGLALSGGGVRSATFCYGLVTALARSRLFARFDLMSTVSGGGYTGAMLGRLAHDPAIRDAHALQQRLAQGVESRERRWLRANSRYLIPRGSRDWLFALVTFVRNLAGMHIELGVLGVVLGCMLGLLNIGVWGAADAWITQAALGSVEYTRRTQAWALVADWPTLWLFALVPALFAAGAAGGYWYLPLDGIPPAEADARRHRATSWMGKALTWTGTLLLLGAMDWIAWRIASKPDLLPLLGGGLAVLLPMLRALLPAVQSGTGGASPRVLEKLPTIIDVAGQLALVALGIFWISVVDGVLARNVWDPDVNHVYYAHAAALTGLALAAALTWMAISGRSLEFLNRSSLHHFYRSRLTRAYLGAANGERQSRADKTVTRTDAGDDLPFDRYEPHLRGGPVHLINVCVNQTVQRHGLFNIDRQGDLMTLAGPAYYRTEQQAWTEMARGTAHTLGTWMAISGAAAAPGLGSATRRGWAALLTMLGLRLGYWWDAGPSSGAQPRRGTLVKYTHLRNELFGQLPGSAERVRYLSDGGHSENTGVYPLLQAGCKLIVLADCGADPEYRFGDLENLIRRARIDLGCDIRFLPSGGDLPATFGTLDELAARDSTACLAAAAIHYGSGEQGVLVLVKPNLTLNLPEDIYNYSRDHAAFPQQSTADQFFGEDQWESYYALGLHLGGMITSELPDCLLALQCSRTRSLLRQTTGLQAGAPQPGDVAPAKARRVPLRMAGATVASTTVGLGAIATLVTGLSGAVLTTRGEEASGVQDAALVRPLYEAYAALPLRSGPPDPAAVARMAAQQMHFWRTVRAKGQYVDFVENKEVVRMLTTTVAQCAALRDKPAACELLLDGFDCPGPVVTSANVIRSGYWARSEQEFVRPARFCDLGVPAGAAVPALVAADAPASQACKGVQVYIQIYGPDGRANMRALREQWRKFGASVPPIEDVLDSARRQGRTPPTPYAVPTLIHHGSPLAEACAAALQQAGAKGQWEVKPLPAGFKSTSATVEAWVPPAAAVPELHAGQTSSK